MTGFPAHKFNSEGNRVEPEESEVWTGLIAKIVWCWLKSVLKKHSLTSLVKFVFMFSFSACVC